MVIHILLEWGFPFYLVCIEALFRSASEIDTSGFIGPAIAIAGLSFLLPLTRPKRIPEETINSDYYREFQASIRNNVISVGLTNSNDEIVVKIAWISILFGFLFWLWSSSISLSNPTDTLNIIGILKVPFHVAIGSINYILAAFLTGWKSRV